MKKIVISILLLIVLVIAGYFIYTFFQNSSIYELTLQSELNPTDFQKPGGQMKQTRETYRADGLGWFGVNILQYSNESSATNGISELKKEYNPGMIVLNTKYVNYYLDSSSKTYHHYFYQSGKNIIIIDYTGIKDDGDAFIIWYYLKHPNQ